MTRITFIKNEISCRNCKEKQEDRNKWKPNKLKRNLRVYVKLY